MVEFNPCDTCRNPAVLAQLSEQATSAIEYIAETVAREGTLLEEMRGLPLGEQSDFGLALERTYGQVDKVAAWAARVNNLATEVADLPCPAPPSQCPRIDLVLAKMMEGFPGHTEQ